VEYINTSRDVQLALQAQQLRLQQSAIRRLRIIVGLAVGAAVIAAILLGTIVQLGRNLRNTTEANTFTLAEQSLAAGNYDRAIAYYNTVIDEFDAAEGYEGRGQSHLGDGDYEAAIADFTLALENGDVSADIYYNRGQAYARLSQWEQAIADYDAAVELDAEYVDAYYRQGIAHIQSGDIESALEDFDTAIDLDPTYAAAYNERGKVSLQAGEFEDALEDFQEASQIQPTYAEAVYNEGMAYLGMEDRSNAVEAFTEAILIDPNYALAYYQRGLVFAQNGSIEEAMFNYGLSTRLDTTLASTEAFNLYLETLENAGYSFDLPEDYQHTVRSTETLATISLQYNLMATELILLNELEDGTFLVPGRVLRLSEEGRGDDGPPPRSEARLQQPPPPDASDGVRPPRPGDGNPPPTPSEPGGNNDGRLRFDTDDDGPDDASPGGRDDDGGDDDNIGDGD
jgi:tetratricopeptide (TPR) repeat protein